MYQRNYMTAKQLVDKIRAGEQEKPQVKRLGLAGKSPKSYTVPDIFSSTADYFKLAQDATTKSDGEESSGFAGHRLPESLSNNSEFMASIKSIVDAYPNITEQDLYNVMQIESSFNPKAYHKGSKAYGLFQITPESLKDLGYTLDQFRKMGPAQQAKVYKEYLDRWDFANSTGVGIIQAAPAYRKASPDTVIYEVGSPAWKANPSWREGEDGPITVRSVNELYRRGRK